MVTEDAVIRAKELFFEALGFLEHEQWLAGLEILLAAQKLAGPRPSILENIYACHVALGDYVAGNKVLGEILHEPLDKNSAIPTTILRHFAGTHESGDLAAYEELRNIFNAHDLGMQITDNRLANLFGLISTIGDIEFRENILRTAITRGCASLIEPFYLRIVTDDPELINNSERRKTSGIGIGKNGYGNEDGPLKKKPRPQRIRDVAFVSSDLKGHAVGHLMHDFFKELSRRNTSLTIYANCPRSGSDLMQATYINYADKYCDIFDMSDDCAISVIKESDHDVIIDLNGHTKGERLGLYAERLAPAVMTWLGYPGATSSSGLDYAILDKNIMPENSPESFQESPVYLKIYQPASPSLYPEPTIRRRSGSHVVLGCLNNQVKITSNWLDALTGVLTGVEATFLLLEPGPVARKIIINHFSKTLPGVNLTFLPRTSLAKYLSYFNEIDLILDTFPYGGHTSVTDALMMGCPVLSMVGNSIHSRVGYSIYKFFDEGLAKKFCTYSEEEYVVRAGDILRQLKRDRGRMIDHVYLKRIRNAEDFTTDFLHSIEKLV